MKARNLSKILQPYTSGWVVINDRTNSVVVHAKEFKEILTKVKELKDKDHMFITSAYPRKFGFLG